MQKKEASYNKKIMYASYNLKPTLLNVGNFILTEINVSKRWNSKKFYSIWGNTKINPNFYLGSHKNKSKLLSPI